MAIKSNLFNKKKENMFTARYKLLKFMLKNNVSI